MHNRWSINPWEKPPAALLPHKIVSVRDALIPEGHGLQLGALAETVPTHLSHHLSGLVPGWVVALRSSLYSFQVFNVLPVQATQKSFTKQKSL